MQIRTEILQQINNVSDRLSLAMALEVTEQSVIKAISKNAENGPLTKYTALQKIAELTGVKKHADLLEPSKAIAQ